MEALGFEANLLANNIQVTAGVEYVTFSLNDAVVFSNDFVIADLNGVNGTGRLLREQEQDTLARYLDRGGKLLLTGGNVLSRPDDEGKMALVGAGTMDRAMVASVDSVVSNALPGAAYSAVQVGDRVDVADQVYDRGTPAAAETVVQYSVADGSSKLMRRQTLEGGVAYLWNGNMEAVDWSRRGVLQDMLKDILVEELKGEVTWLTAVPAAPTVTARTIPVNIHLDGSGLEPGRYEAALVVTGNYSGAENDSVRIVFDVAEPLIRATSTTGVRDWRNLLLGGNGSQTSALFQVIYAGNDGAINEPGPDGGTTGDDVLLRQSPLGMTYGRIGAGYEQAPNGRFNESFRLLAGLNSSSPGRRVYVRAWDGATFEDSVAYGESGVYDLQFVAFESHDFGTWTVDRVPGYPGTRPYRDANGDTVPDGWYVANGLDPRLPIGPLPGSATPTDSIGSYGSGIGQLYQPAGVVLSATHLFVLDTRNNRICVWTRPVHTWAHAFGSAGTANGQFASPLGIARHPTENRIAVADTLNHRVQVFTFVPATGVLTHERTIGGPSAGSGNGQFNKPAGVAIDALGRIIVADTANHRVQIFNAAGGFITKFGTLGSANGQMSQPAGVCVFPNGTILLADTGNQRVQLFSGSGTFVWSFGSQGTADGQFKRPSGVQVGFNNRFYVTDTDNHRVQVFSETRQHLLTFGLYGDLAGEIKFPLNCMPVADSTLAYVADTWNNRVQLFDTVIDTDADGMEDIWETHTGLDPNDPNDALIDSDGDGLINIGEYRANLNPHLIDSDGDGSTDLEFLGGGPDVPLFKGFTSDGTRAWMSWLTRSNRNYRLQVNTNLLHGAGWVDLPGSGFQATVTEITQVTNTVPAGAKTLFYRAVEHP